MLYVDIFQKLNKENVNYLVVGGVALVLHGVVRFTTDLDLMLAPEDTNLQKFLTAMEDLGFKPKLPALPQKITWEILRKWKKSKNLEALCLYDPSDPFKLVDIVIDPVVAFKDAFKNKKIVMTSNIKIPVVSVADLKKLKKAVGRPQDLEDIASLDKIMTLGKENDN